ncbi:MAG: hypothetical protein A2V66_07115 [Ignavibacteria bacterium RBG_13_36_8]|nr:MAG: hypothetical protein A2V66_07115 [Ignavibacteria bacterium RBG_13_36_8]
MKKTPFFAEKLLYMFLPKGERDFLLGDFEYLYREKVEEAGHARANLWYVFQILKNIPLFTIHSINWGIEMLKNYLLIAFRNLKKQKLYSAITISGLAIGLGIFILFWLITDISFNADEFHKNSDRIYGVIQVVQSGSGAESYTAITPAPMKEALLNEFPEIEDAVRFFPAGRSIISHNGNNFYEDQIQFVDPNFLSFFSFKIKLGNSETMLSGANSVVLSEEVAEKYFGDKNPIGQAITFNNQAELIVTGVIENAPITSSINYQFLVSLIEAEKFYPWMSDWRTNSQATFILLKQGVNPTDLEVKLSSFVTKYYPIAPETPKQLYIIPITDFLFETIGIDTYLDKNFPVVSYLMIASAIVLLVIVSINFMSLSTARYTSRAKEVGVRKVIGASRGSLIKQFLSESILLTLIAFPFAVLVFEAAFYLIAGNWWTANYISLFDEPRKLITLFLITIAIGAFSGIYPAFFLSAFRPATVLKGTFEKSKKGSRFRKIIVVAQFSLAIILIVFAAVINKQFNHIMNADFGYNRDNIVAIELNNEARKNLDLLKKRLSNQRDILLISSSNSLPCQWNTEAQVVPQGFSSDEAFTVNSYGVDNNFIEMFEMGMLMGRTFQEEYADTSNFIINETAVRQFQWEDPIGKEIVMGTRKGRVIGVVKDFLFKDIHYPISASVLYIEKNDLNYLLAKISSNKNLASAVGFIENEWNKILPTLPFEYLTHEQYYHDIYIGFNTVGMICGIIGLIGVFLSCLGMLALATYAVEKRKKEIGIRKVLGASELSVIKLLVKDFLKWVIISNVIGLPVSYYLTNAFLSWATIYRIEVGFELLFYTAFGSISIALVTVASQTLNAARSKPVDSLKYE